MITITFTLIELKRSDGFVTSIQWNPAIPLPHAGDHLTVRLDGRDASFRVSRVCFQHREVRLADQNKSQVSIGITLHVDPEYTEACGKQISHDNYCGKPANHSGACGS